jgi:hypothetical protein
MSSFIMAILRKMHCVMLIVDPGLVVLGGFVLRSRSMTGGI